MKPLTDEQVRILRAAAQGRLYSTAGGRWQIEGELAPDRRSRERLRGRMLIDYGRDEHGRQTYSKLVATEKGLEALGDAS